MRTCRVRRNAGSWFWSISATSARCPWKTSCTNLISADQQQSGMCSFSNPSWMKSYLDADRVKRFDLWLAHWTDKTNYAGAYGMWQNSSSGKVNGINGNVDTDFAYKDYPTIIKGKKLNGFTGSGQQPTVPDQPDPEPETTLMASKQSWERTSGSTT